jgi:hypothetical protein
MATLKVFGRPDTRLRGSAVGTGNLLDVEVRDAIRVSRERDAEALPLEGSTTISGSGPDSTTW